MKQKFTSTRLLLSAIGFIILSATTSCDKGETDYRVRAKWIYVNETSYTITFKPAEEWSQFSISPHDTVVYDQEGEGPESVKPESYFPPMNAETVTFDGVKCNAALAVKLSDVASYESRRIQTRYYEFTYRFTGEDYTQTEDCK